MLLSSLAVASSPLPSQMAMSPAATTTGESALTSGEGGRSGEGVRSELQPKAKSVVRRATRTAGAGLLLALAAAALHSLRPDGYLTMIRSISILMYRNPGGWSAVNSTYSQSA